MRRLLKEIYRAISQAGFAIFSFFTVWLVTRFLGAEGYGFLVGLLTASQVAQLFINWSAFSVTRFGVEEFVERGNINRTFWGRIVIALASTMLMLAMSPLWLPPLTAWLKLPPTVAPFIVASDIQISACYFLETGFRHRVV